MEIVKEWKRERFSFPFSENGTEPLKVIKNLSKMLTFRKKSNIIKKLFKIKINIGGEI